MSNNDDDNVAIIKRRKLPDWHVDEKGRRRLQGGRFNNQRIAELLRDIPAWHTMGDLSRVIFGTTSKILEKRVRGRIPGLRNFMLYTLQEPMITQYGERGRIFRIKYYNPADEFDRALLRMELDRARDKRELSDKRYEELLHAFHLPAPVKVNDEAA